MTASPDQVVSLAAPPDRLGCWCLFAMPIMALANLFPVTTVAGLAIRPTDVLFLTLCMIWAVRALLFSVSKHEFALLACLSLLGCIVVLASEVRPSYDVDWRRLARFIQTLAWGVFAAAFIRARNDWVLFWNSVALSGGVLGAASMVFVALDPELHRVAGFVSASAGEQFDDQLSFNEIAAVHALAIVLMLARVAQGHASIFVWSALLLNGAGLLLVQSRSGSLAVLLVLLAYTGVEFARGLMHGRLSARAVYAAIAVLAFAGLLTTVGEYRAVDRFRDAFEGDAPIEERLQLWTLGLGLLDEADAWTLMVGLGSETLPRLISAPTLDSFYLDHLLSEGALGFALILLAIYSSLATRWADHSSRLPLWATAAVAATVSLTGNVLVDPFYGAATIVVLWGGANSRRVPV